MTSSLNGHEFEQVLGNDEGQGSLECCSPWGGKESDMTESLNKNNIYQYISQYMLWSSNFILRYTSHWYIYIWMITKTLKTTLLESLQQYCCCCSITKLSLTLCSSMLNNKIQKLAKILIRMIICFWCSVTHLCLFETPWIPWSDGTGCHDLSFLTVEF